MSNSKSKQDKCSLQVKYSSKHAVLNYYLILMFTVFPLFASDAYFNIRHDKYYLFVALTGVVLIAELLMILSVKFDSGQKDTHDVNVTGKTWYESFSFTDWAMIALLLTSTLSTLFSPYEIQYSIFGTAGRNNGLLLITLYVGIYFVITRLHYYMEYVFLAFAGVSTVVFILSVVNYHYIDPLGMYVNLDSDTVEDFISTIGNKNFLSSYICVSLPVFVTMSVHVKKKLYKAIYLASSAFGFMALMTADSDSGILGLGVFFVVFLIWYSSDISRLKYYFLNITIMLASAKFIKYLTLILKNAFNCKTKEIDRFQELFIESDIAYVLIAVMAVITAVLFIIDTKKPELAISKAVPISLIVVFSAFALGIIGIIFYYSVIDTKTDLGSLETLIRFNNKWGTHRGFMWIKSFEIFDEASFIQKLFGTGPDTYHYAFSPYFAELEKYGDSSTNAAHNEYINYLITIGIAGLASYVAAVGGCIVRAVKTAKSNPISIVFVSAVICYSVQAFVNIAQPITTPLFIIFLALTESVSRKNS